MIPHSCSFFVFSIIIHSINPPLITSFIIIHIYKFNVIFHIYTIDIWLPPEVLNLCLYFLVSVTSPPCTVSIVVLNSNPPALDVLNISGSTLLSVVAPAGNIVGSLEGEPSLVPLNLKKVGLTPDKDKP
mgnify:CR=1 FL=1